MLTRKYATLNAYAAYLDMSWICLFNLQLNKKKTTYRSEKFGLKFSLAQQINLCNINLQTSSFCG